MADNDNQKSELFIAKDPAAEFSAFSREETQRIADTDPNFDGELYQQAIELALSHLAPPTEPEDAEEDFEQEDAQEDSEQEDISADNQEGEEP